jgi:hypothetical protein
MRVSIMQPYLFPYIGYFQLMAACDLFVAADDAQLTRRGWINRNRILVNDAPFRVTMPVATASHRLPINARQYVFQNRLALRFRHRLMRAYRRAPFFDTAMDIVDDALDCADPNVATFNVRALRCVARRLGIHTPVRLASDVSRKDGLSGQALVIDRCLRLGASQYLNPIGGRALYDEAVFAEAGIELRFVEPSVPFYSQFGARPVPSLSIIDVLMFNDLESTRRMLAACKVVAPVEAAATAGEVAFS